VDPLYTGTLIKNRTQNDGFLKNTVYIELHIVDVYDRYDIHHILIKIDREIKKKKLTVEIWNLNLKFWPLENRKNNGGADSNFLEQKYEIVLNHYNTNSVSTC